MAENTATDGPARERQFVVPPPELPRQLVLDFLDRCRENTRLLRAAVEREDYTQAGVLGHRMKGTGSSYGFPELSACGSAIERAAQHQAAAALRTAIAHLETYLATVDLAGG